MAKFDYDNKTLRSMFGLQAGKTLLPKLTITLEQITQEVQKLAGKLSISGGSAQENGSQYAQVNEDHR